VVCTNSFIFRVKTRMLKIFTVCAFSVPLNKQQFTGFIQKIAKKQRIVADFFRL